MDDPNRPVLSYASPAEPGEVPFLATMRLWRSIAGISLVVAVAGALLFPPVAEMGQVGFAVAGVMTLVYMTRAAVREVGAGYAVRHLVLAILLTPVFFFGVMVVPLLVQSDLIKWRDTADRSRRPVDETE